MKSYPCAAARARRNGTRATASARPLPSRRIALARRAIQPVASESAGPPWLALYLNPPSRGGLWEGVTTMPSARLRSSGAMPRLWRRIAWLTAGVGV